MMSLDERQSRWCHSSKIMPVSRSVCNTVATTDPRSSTYPVALGLVFAWPRNGQAYSLPQWLARLLVPRQSVCQSELLLPLHLQVTVCYTYIFLTPLWLLPFRGKGACILHWTLRAMLLGGNSWQVLPNRTGQGQGVRLNTVKKHPF